MVPAKGIKNFTKRNFITRILIFIFCIEVYAQSDNCVVKDSISDVNKYYNCLAVYYKSQNNLKLLSLLEFINQKESQAHPEYLFWKGYYYAQTGFIDSSKELYNKYIRSEKNRLYSTEVQKHLKGLNTSSVRSDKNLFPEKVTLINDTVRHSNGSVITASDSSYIFYYSQKTDFVSSAFPVKIFSFQNHKSQEIKFPLSGNQKISRVLGATKDGATIFVQLSVNNSDIYYSQFTAGKWQALKPFYFINSKSREGGLCLSPDNKMLVFATDKDHKGNMDLYYIEYLEDKSWSVPRILSAGLNSEMDEDYPAFSRDGRKLYFASKGFNSLGSYDLYCSIQDSITKKWSDPVNLGIPMNSIYDDISPVVNALGQLEMFSTNRYNEAECYDIIRLNSGKKVLLTVQAFDTDSLLKIDGLKIRIRPKDGTFHEGSFYLNGSNGSYVDSVYAGREYKIDIYNGKQLLLKDQKVMLLKPGVNHYFLRLAAIKNPKLYYKGKKIPLFAKYTITYENLDLSPASDNKNVMDRIMELLTHLNIYNLQIQYPVKPDNQPSKLTLDRIRRLESILIKEGVSASDLQKEKQLFSNSNSQQITLSLEFKFQ